MSFIPIFSFFRMYPRITCCIWLSYLNLFLHVIFEEHKSSICRMSLTLRLSKVSLQWFRLFFVRNATEMMVCPSQDHIRRQIVLVCPGTADVNFDHLVKVVSTRFLSYKVTVFLFIMKKSSVVRCLETLNIIFLTELSPTGCSIHWWSFLTPSFVLCLSVGILPYGGRFPLLLTCCLIHYFISPWTHRFLFYSKCYNLLNDSFWCLNSTYVASGIPYKLTRVSFWHVPILLLLRNFKNSCLVI